MNSMVSLFKTFFTSKNKYKKSKYWLINFSFTFVLIFVGNTNTHAQYTELTVGGTSPLSFGATTIMYSGDNYSLPIDYDVDGDIDLLTINSRLPKNEPFIITSSFMASDLKINPSFKLMLSFSKGQG